MTYWFLSPFLLFFTSVHTHRYMANRKPFQLKPVLALYNLFQVFSCIYIIVKVFEYKFYNNNLNETHNFSVVVTWARVVVQKYMEMCAYNKGTWWCLVFTTQHLLVHNFREGSWVSRNSLFCLAQKTESSHFLACLPSYLDFVTFLVEF